MGDYETGSQRYLIKQAKGGDVKAFSKLYEMLSLDLYKFALYTLKHPQDAEDAVSDAVVAAYENIGKLRKEDAFRSWIFKILSNQCKRRMSAVKTSSMETEPEIAVPEEDYAGKYDVREAFSRLSEEESRIVALSVFGGYQSAEIGEILDMKANTVRSKQSRALEKMRHFLGKGS